jgi:hypothetical protein
MGATYVNAPNSVSSPVAQFPPASGRRTSDGPPPSPNVTGPSVSGNKGHAGGKFGSEYSDVGRRFCTGSCGAAGCGCGTVISGSGGCEGDCVRFVSDARRGGGVTSRQRCAISLFTLKLSNRHSSANRMNSPSLARPSAFAYHMTAISSVRPSQLTFSGSRHTPCPTIALSASSSRHRPPMSSSNCLGHYSHSRRSDSSCLLQLRSYYIYPVCDPLSNCSSPLGSVGSSHGVGSDKTRLALSTVAAQKGSSERVLLFPNAESKAPVGYVRCWVLQYIRSKRNCELVDVKLFSLRKGRECEGVSICTSQGVATIRTS